MTEHWKVNLEIFEGPLDLLLHLINKYEIDIYDIPIAKITTQYMEYLHAMQILQLDVAGDYLVMAATLMSIKSQMLVPRNDAWNEEEFIVEEEDPREELMEMLLEYRKFKNATTKLEYKQSERADFFTKEPTDVTEYQENIPLKKGDVDLIDLIEAFQALIRRNELKEPEETTIETEEISVTDKMKWIELKIKNSPSSSISFRHLFEYYSSKEVVVTFLALLELIKENKVDFKQDKTFSDIKLAFLNNDF
ncbi:segregation and condensation protein A [Marinilactibacillus psychrotolerans]|uniref:Segregation and condensation protein A n=1 Tax=Marinilactibacillus psychrotolerans TaxID=191770 RepID=A0ABW8UH01_9LACT